MKVVRELGLERRETVWSLSTVGVKNWEDSTLVREDQVEQTYGVPVVIPIALLGSYVCNG
jgi:hypothetical protein